MIGEAYRDKAPLTASAAATQILDGLRNDSTRILVGEDAIIVDLLSRVWSCESLFEPAVV